MTTGGRERHIVVLLPSEQDRQELSNVARDGFTFHYMEDSSWESYEPSKPTFDPVVFARRSIDEACRLGTNGVLATDDLANFIAAVICREIGLPGSSVDSMLYANHKFYGRTIESDPIRYDGYSLFKEEWRTHRYFPAQIKPPCLYFSLLQSRVDGPEELATAVAALREAAPRWEHPFVKLFQNFLPAERYPLATAHSFVVEEFVNAASQHAVEGWADSEGRQYIWAISDNNYFPGEGTALDNNCVPSRLSPREKERLSQVALAIARSAGLRSTFWNIELWIRRDGRIQATELNGRICASMTCLYKAIYGESQYPYAVKLACGLPLPSMGGFDQSPVVGAMFAISTTRRGKVQHLLDFQALERAKLDDGVVRAKLMFPPDSEISWYQTGGRCCLARVWIVGSTYEEIYAKGARIRAEVLKEV